MLTALALLFAASSARTERLPLRVFTRADGLATDRVGVILPDSYGFLWFGTGGGLSRFDGRTFQTFGVAEGLSNPYVNDMLEERRGRYWVATNGGGLFLFTPRTPEMAPDAPRFRRVSVGESPASNRVNVIARDASRRLLIGTDDGLFVMPSTDAPQRLERVEQKDRRLNQPLVQVWALRQQPNGVVWVGTSIGLFALLPDGQVLHRPIRPLQGADHVFAILEQPDGTLLIGHDSGLFLVRLQVAPAPMVDVSEPVTPPVGNVPSAVRGLLRTRDGTVWLTGADGLSVIDGSRRRLVIDRRESSRGLKSIAEDAAGNLWVSRLSGGVLRITRGGISTYDESDGLGEPRYGAIFEAASGELCVVGRREISVFDGGTFTRVRPGLPPDVVGVGRSYGSALQDHTGEWWIPAGDRLYRFRRVSRVHELSTASPAAVYTTRDGLAGGDIFKMFEDSRGDIWLNSRIPGREVVTRWDRASGIFDRYGEQQGLRPHNAVNGFAEDRSGAIWFGFLEGGVARYREGRFEWIRDFDQLGGGTGPIHLDRQGRIWIATATDVRRIDSPTADRSGDIRVTTVHGLERTRVSAFLDDRRGDLYLNGEEGLIRWDIDAERAIRIPVRDETVRLGSAAFRDRSGTLWFAGPAGVTTVRPSETATQMPVTLRIGTFRVNGRPLPIGDLGQTEVPPMTLAPAERRIEIGFFPLGASGEDDVRFQYRLEGAASEWSAPSAVTSLDFAHLAPGAYRFEVKPVSADGTSLGHSASASFRIPRPVWARWWFILLAGSGILAATSYLHRRRVARAVELERIRTSIASDLHDDIGSNLSQISLLSEMLHGKGVDSDPHDAATLASISDLSRESVDAMSDIVWAIDPHKDHLTSLTSRMRRFASELLAARGVRFHMNLDASGDIEIGADLRRHIYLVFKEALNNVVRHSDATHVEIDLRLDGGGQLLLKISDDGRGFDGAENSSGHGLRSLRERAKKAGGSLEIRSTPGQGTAVTLRVPLRRAHMIM